MFGGMPTKTESNMAVNDKLTAAGPLSATEEEILTAAQAEVDELSAHERPMVVGVINEA